MAGARIGQLIALALSWNALAPAWAVAAQDPDPLSFVVLGHIRSDSDARVHPLLEEIVDEIERLDPDLVFLTGDAIWGGLQLPVADPEQIERAWDDLDQAFSRLDVPIHRVPGNHDINDAVTRDVYYRRYGRPPQAVDHGGCRFLLLCSFHVPAGEWVNRFSPRWKRGLDAEQVEFVRKEAANSGEYEHVFLFLHHLLWWRPDAPWWTEIHPYLVGTNVSAVIGGDLHQLKYSYMRRDGIDYVHAAMDLQVRLRPADRLQREEEIWRRFAFELDPFLYITVHGQDVNIDVVSVGETTNESLSPERWANVHAPTPAPSLRERIRRALGGPTRRIVLAGSLLGSLIVGVILGRLWTRRQARA